MALAELAAVMFLIRDRDTKVAASFSALLAAEGNRVITQTSVQPARANALAEQLVGTIGRDYLDPMVTLGRRYLQSCSPSTSSTRARRTVPLPAPTVQVRHDSCPHRRGQRRTAPTNRRLGPPHPGVSTRRLSWAHGFSALAGFAGPVALIGWVLLVGGLDLADHAEQGPGSGLLSNLGHLISGRGWRLAQALPGSAVATPSRAAIFRA